MRESKELGVKAAGSVTGRIGYGPRHWKTRTQLKTLMQITNS